MRGRQPASPGLPATARAVALGAARRKEGSREWATEGKTDREGCERTGDI